MGNDTSRHGIGVIQYKSKTDLVYERLRAAVLAGDYAPGDRIVLSTVAEGLGVSKVPVREAVTRLVGEGWLEQQPNVGPVVRALRAGEIRETAVIRAALEYSAVREAVPLHNEQSLAELRELHADMGNALTTASHRFPSLNVDFHSAVIAPCPLTELRQLTVSMMERTLRYQTVHRVPTYPEQAHAEHEEILTAVATGDAERAASLTREHIRSAAQELQEQLLRSQ